MPPNNLDVCLNRMWIRFDLWWSYGTGAWCCGLTIQVATADENGHVSWGCAGMSAENLARICIICEGSREAM